MKPIMKERAEAKRIETQGRPEKLSQISDAVNDDSAGKFRADEAVSELANVSRDTIRKIERIEHAYHIPSRNIKLLIAAFPVI